MRVFMKRFFLTLLFLLNAEKNSFAMMNGCPEEVKCSGGVTYKIGWLQEFGTKRIDLSLPRGHNKLIYHYTNDKFNFNVEHIPSPFSPENLENIDLNLLAPHSPPNECLYVINQIDYNNMENNENTQKIELKTSHEAQYIVEVNKNAPGIRNSWITIISCVSINNSLFIEHYKVEEDKLILSYFLPETSNIDPRIIISLSYT